MHSNTRTIDGIPMRWEEQGEGTPLVLIHGIPTSPALWRHVVPKISGARCLAFEMVGYGASIPAGSDRDISVGKQADYLMTWLRALGIEKAVLAGHDLGGGVAHIAAIRHPEMCSGLFLTNGIGYDSWPIASVKAMRAGGALLRHLPDAAFKQVLRTFLRRGHDNATKADAALQQHWPHYRENGGAAAFIRQTRSLDVEDTASVAGQLPGLKMPARLAWGVADKFQTIEYGEKFAHDLGAPLRRIDGGKHFTPEDHPDVIAEEINLLLAEVKKGEQGR